LKIAIVVHRFPQLSETFIINQITALIDAGVDVRIFSYYKPDLSQKLHPQFKAYNLQNRVYYGVQLPVQRIKKYSNFFRYLFIEFLRNKKTALINSLNFYKFGKSVLNLQYFYRALLFAEHNEFDIIHCHFGPIGHDIVQLREMGLIKGKIITSFHGYDFQNKDILDEYESYKLLFQYGDGFIANSNFTSESLLALGCEINRLVVIPVSASSDIFNSKNKHKEDFHNAFKILTIARLEEVKGVEYAIRAIYKLDKGLSVNNFVYNIIGSGSLEIRLKKLVEELGIEDKVNFWGFKTQDEVLDFLLDANAFLLTSITTKAGASEAQGLVLLEAQAAGVPVIASRTGGVPDSMIDGETGLLVPEKDVDAIASSIMKLFKEPEKRREMGEKGKAFVKDNFDQKTLCMKMLSFYKDVLQNHSSDSGE
jgi:colanic acid/amylovoran biosynthesis glycosyltransferase